MNEQTPPYNILARFSDSAGRFNFMYLAMGEKIRIELVGDTHIHLTATGTESMTKVADYAMQQPGFIEIHVKRCPEC